MIAPTDQPDRARRQPEAEESRRSTRETTEGVRLFRRFLLLTILATTSILTFVGIGLEAILYRATIAHAQGDAQQATLAFRDLDITRLIADLSSTGEPAAKARAMLRERVRPFLSAFDIETVRLYTPDRTIVFALADEVLGARDTDTPGFDLALAGEAVTTPKPNRGPADADERWADNARVIECLIPLTPNVWNADASRNPGQIAGVLMITLNAAKEFRASQAILIRAVLVLAVVLFAVFAVLSLLMYRAQQTIRARAHDLAEERARTRAQSALRTMEERLHAAERLASIGALAAGVGHDLNNLLLPMRGQIRSLDAAELPENARHQVRALRESIEFLRQLGDNLRLLAGGGESAGRDAKTDVSAWWRQVGPMLSRAIPKHAQFHVDIPDDLPPVATPAPRLTQAVLNLLVNAGDAFDPASDAQPVVRLTARESDDGFVEITVEDTGRGMTDEVARRAFEPFFTTKRRSASTGLGLALVQGVVRSSGGAIDLKSTPGKGTRIALTLPIAEPEHRAARLHAGEASTPVACVSIDDDRLGAYACAVLRDAGFHVSRTPEADPGPGLLWITEPGERALNAARTFLSEEPSRRVIVLGAGSPPWQQAGAVALGEVLDQESLLRALGQAGLMPAGDAV